VERFNLIDPSEFDFVDEELKDQVTNNSLWSYRYFLVNKIHEFSENLVDDEIRYTLDKLKLDMNNEAAWVYLRGWLASS